MRTKHCANVYAYSCSVSARASHLQVRGRWIMTTSMASNFHSTLSSEALISGRRPPPRAIAAMLLRSWHPALLHSPFHRKILQRISEVTSPRRFEASRASAI